MKIYLFAIVVCFSFAFISCNKDKEDGRSSEKVINNAIVSNTECKHNVTRMGYESNQSCIIYAYDESARKLNVTHVDAGFNCCPGELTCEISYVGDTIVFTENESVAQCNCSCLFDLNIEIEGLAKDAYILKFIEPYAEGMEQLIFSIDLAVLDTGTFCVTREGYPWGIVSF